MRPWDICLKDAVLQVLGCLRVAMENRRTPVSGIITELVYEVAWERWTYQMSNAILDENVEIMLNGLAVNQFSKPEYV